VEFGLYHINHLGPVATSSVNSSRSLTQQRLNIVSGDNSVSSLPVTN